MIYVTGHGRFTATERELAELKKYIGDGGIVVAEACCSDKTFYNSFASVGSRLSNMMMSAPLSAASLASSAFSTSTSTLMSR